MFVGRIQFITLISVKLKHDKNGRVQSMCPFSGNNFETRKNLYAMDVPRNQVRIRKGEQEGEIKCNLRDPPPANDHTAHATNASTFFSLAVRARNIRARGGRL